MQAERDRAFYSTQGAHPSPFLHSSAPAREPPFSVRAHSTQQRIEEREEGGGDGGGRKEPAGLKAPFSPPSLPRDGYGFCADALRGESGKEEPPRGERREGGMEGSGRPACTVCYEEYGGGGEALPPPLWDAGTPCAGTASPRCSRGEESVLSAWHPSAPSLPTTRTCAG